MSLLRMLQRDPERVFGQHVRDAAGPFHDDDRMALQDFLKTQFLKLVTPGNAIRVKVIETPAASGVVNIQKHIRWRADQGQIRDTRALSDAAGQVRFAGPQRAVEGDAYGTVNGGRGLAQA